MMLTCRYIADEISSLLLDKSLTWKVVCSHIKSLSTVEVNQANVSSAVHVAEGLRKQSQEATFLCFIPQRSRCRLQPSKIIQLPKQDMCQ